MLFSAGPRKVLRLIFLSGIILCFSWNQHNSIFCVFLCNSTLNSCWCNCSLYIFEYILIFFFKEICLRTFQTCSSLGLLKPLPSWAIPLLPFWDFLCLSLGLDSLFFRFQVIVLFCSVSHFREHIFQQFPKEARRGDKFLKAYMAKNGFVCFLMIILIAMELQVRNQFFSLRMLKPFLHCPFTSSILLEIQCIFWFDWSFEPLWKRYVNLNFNSLFQFYALPSTVSRLPRPATVFSCLHRINTLTFCTDGSGQSPSYLMWGKGPGVSFLPEKVCNKSFYFQPHLRPRPEVSQLPMSEHLRDSVVFNFPHYGLSLQLLGDC